jgi:ADP-heptose:LPS heptosyltransferase
MTFQTKRRVDYWLGGTLLLVLFPLVRLLALALRRDHSLEQRRGCVVIKLVGAGSLFLAMPSMQAIRDRFPPGRFYLVGTRTVTAMAEPFGWFDACWTIDDSSVRRLVSSTLRVLWQVNRHADHLIDLEVHSRLTTVFSVLSMVRNRIGFVDEIVFWRRGFYTHMTFFNVHGPVYVFYDLLAKWFGVSRIPVTAFNQDFRRHVLNAAIPHDMQLPARYVAIGHACSDLGRERQLRPQEWKRLLQPWDLAGFEFVILGGPGDAAFAEAILATLGHGVSLCGHLSIAQSAKVIARSNLYYGIDSMLLHLARALGVRQVSVWGPTSPAILLRPTATAERIGFASLPCSPCIHVNETPPCQGRRDCVAAAVEALVAPIPEQTPSAGVAVGWDVDPNQPAVRAVSVTYA